MAKSKKKDFYSLIDEYKEFVARIDEERDFNPISTGCLSIDISTGIGGFPRYRWSNIWGTKSSGKTTLALNTAKQVLKLDDGKVLYVDVEGGLDFDYVIFNIGIELLKFDEEGNCLNFILIQPDTAEQSFEIAEAGIESDDFDLIIFDSVGALAPLLEKENKFKDYTIGLNSRLLGKFLRRNSNALKHSKKTAFVFINQIRADIKSYFNDVTQPGGYQLEHVISMEIRLFSARKLKVKDEIIGTSTKFVISKNKCAIPFRSFDLYITFGTGIDELKDVVLFSEFLGILKKRGSYYYLGDENVGQGLTNTMLFLESHQETLDTIKELCYNAVISQPDKE